MKFLTELARPKQGGQISESAKDILEVLVTAAKQAIFDGIDSIDSPSMRFYMHVHVHHHKHKESTNHQFK